ncbi:MAG: TetR/AcrR family transcriptional regulator [Clostridia bacterium]|nr:TetR/AcrR family transcriptional regulator [Clostridia bacterium]
MPREMIFKKEDVINTTCNLVKKEGIESVNARRIAKELKSSVHPIFRHFKDMEELKKAVYEKIYETYKEYMLKGINSKEKPYKQMGLSYIKFAKDYPEFFKIIFMQKTDLNAENFVMGDKMGDDVIKAGQTLTGLSFEEQKKFHIKVWIFTHGIACLVATKTVEFTEEEISELLGNTVLEMLKGYKSEGGK